MRRFQRKLVRAALLIVLCVPASAQEIPAEARTGSYSLSATTADILGVQRAEQYSAIVPDDELIEWEIVVPESFDAGQPPGLLVYVSPSNSGKLPRGWLKLLKEHNLIWVAANNSGNRAPVSRRMSYAVLAAALLADRHDLNTRRIFLSGFSGGARVSGLIAGEYPSVFTGAIYIGGAEVWDANSSSDNLRRMRANRYVFLVGSEDDNRAVARSVHSAYEQAEISAVKTIVVRRMGHVLPEARYMSSALKFLDAAD